MPANWNFSVSKWCCVPAWHDAQDSGRTQAKAASWQPSHRFTMNLWGGQLARIPQRSMLAKVSVGLAPACTPDAAGASAPALFAALDR
jgi:hypothetical protein